MRAMKHGSVNWCHLCGKRSSETADVWYPWNAELDLTNTDWIRICRVSALLIAEKATEGDTGPRHGYPKA